MRTVQRSGRAIGRPTALEAGRPVCNVHRAARSGCRHAVMACRPERSAATRSRCHATQFARRRAAATLVRAVLVAVSRGPVPAQAADYLDPTAVREQAAGFPARVAGVWAKA